MAPPIVNFGLLPPYASVPIITCSFPSFGLCLPTLLLQNRTDLSTSTSAKTVMLFCHILAPNSRIAALLDSHKLRVVLQAWLYASPVNLSL